MGYLRKQTAGKNFSVDQTIYAPFGDDPVLISEVVISSQSPRPTNLYWVEYWGCQPYPFSHSAFVDGYNSAGELDAEKVVSLRRESALRFRHRFEKTPDGLGLIQSSQFASETAHHQRPEARCRKNSPQAFRLRDNPPAQPKPQVPDQNETPPATFLASLDEGPVRFLTNATAFFGARNVLRHTGPAGPESVPVPAELLRPAGLSQYGSRQCRDRESAARRPLRHRPRERPDPRQAIHPRCRPIADAAFPLRISAHGFLLRRSHRKIPRPRRQLSSPRAAPHGRTRASSSPSKAIPWVEREVRWHNYYLRSGFTYDDFFAEHIVSQGQVYQYCFGFQGAARDPLQHALPLVFGESRLAKEVLRYTLKSQGADGALPFAITGHGSIMPIPWLPSDLDLWLLWLASEYVLATRDTAFLEERLPTWPFKPRRADPHRSRDAQSLLSPSHRLRRHRKTRPACAATTTTGMTTSTARASSRVSATKSAATPKA